MSSRYRERRSDLVKIEEFVDHVAELMRGDENERLGWKDNCFCVGTAGHCVTVEFDDGSVFQLEATEMPSSGRDITGRPPW